MLSIGRKTAPIVPSAVTINATVFPLGFEEIVSKEIPAENASRKVVVTVERITITRAAHPSPDFKRMSEMSVSEVKIAAPIPIRYIQQLVAP